MTQLNANLMTEPFSAKKHVLRLILIVLLFAGLAGCRSELYTKVSEREANEMMAILLRSGIDADRIVAKDGTSSLVVDKSRIADAIETLKANGYPRDSFATMADVFKGNGLMVSPTEEKARFIYAMSEELSRTISGIDGVLSARVHVVLPKNDLLRQDHTPSSASVFIRHKANIPTETMVPQIKMLVANSVEGLSYDKVSVILVPVDTSQILPSVLKPPGTEEKLNGGSSISDYAFIAGGFLVSLAVTGLAGGGFYLFSRSQKKRKRLAELSSIGN